MNKKNQIYSSVKRFRLAILFIFLSLVFIFINLFAGQSPLMIINASTRSVDYHLLNSDSGKIAFQSPVLLKTNPKETGLCISGLFAPLQNTKISYEIFSHALMIRVSHNNQDTAGFFIPKHDINNPISLNNNTSIIYGTENNCTKETLPVRLPIWGPASMGRKPIAPTNAGIMDPFSGLLMSGNVVLFGQNILGDGLYPAGEFSLPAGAKLSSVKSDSWWGYAIYKEMERSKNEMTTLSVSASTEAESLKLDRLASGVKNEKIETSILNQLTKDPFIASIGLILAGLFFLSEFLISLSLLWKNNDK